MCDCWENSLGGIMDKKIYRIWERKKYENKK